MSGSGTQLSRLADLPARRSRVAGIDSPWRKRSAILRQLPRQPDPRPSPLFSSHFRQFVPNDRSRLCRTAGAARWVRLPSPPVAWPAVWPRGMACPAGQQLVEHGAGADRRRSPRRCRRFDPRLGIGSAGNWRHPHDHRLFDVNAAILIHDLPRPKSAMPELIRGFDKRTFCDFASRCRVHRTGE